MLEWLLLGTALFLVVVNLPALFILGNLGPKGYLGTRDDEGPEGVMLGRARRTVRNFIENYPPFIALGILAMLVPGTNMEQAILGAKMFVIARAIYSALYMMGVPIARSAMFLVGWAGLILMIVALL